MVNGVFQGIVRFTDNAENPLRVEDLHITVATLGNLTVSMYRSLQVHCMRGWKRFISTSHEMERRAEEEYGKVLCGSSFACWMERLERRIEKMEEVAERFHQHYLIRDSLRVLREVRTLCCLPVLNSMELWGCITINDIHTILMIFIGLLNDIHLEW